MDQLEVENQPVAPPITEVNSNMTGAKFSHFCKVSSKIVALIFGPILKSGIYYFDLFTDYLNTYNQFNNCHFYFGAASLGILISSYFTTVTYLKFRMEENLYSALCYPILHSIQQLKHMKTSFNSIWRGEEKPEKSIKEKIYSHHIVFIEATSESVLQLALSCLIIREFGISPNTWERVIQLSSLLTSLISVCNAFAQVYN